MPYFGRNIRTAVFGQSHAAAIGVTIDGLPAGEAVDAVELEAFMARRAPEQNRMTTQRREADRPEILCGIVDGRTCGAPLTSIIRNGDTRSKDYAAIADLPRPSHADWPAHVRYGGWQDVRGGGAFSARLTAPLCIAGGIAMQLLEEENIRIGSLSSFSHITRDPIIQKYINVLGEAVDMVGGPQIRNIGTIGGNTCNGVTSADSASTLHAWEAIVELTGKDGIRRLPIKDFYIKAGQVDIRVEDGEIQTAILIPKASYENCYGYYIKYAMRNAMDIATLGCSVNVRLSPDKQTIERARIAYGVAGPVPMRCPSAEAAAKDKPLTLETAEEFSLAVLNDIRARDSWRASKAFREHIAVEMAKRCLIESIKRAGGVIK